MYSKYLTVCFFVGEHDRSKKEGTEQYFNASQCCIHQSFQLETSYGFDIAIVRLSNAANLTRAVGLVCLPEQNHRVVVGQVCYLAGITIFIANKGDNPHACLL